jgi:hypothetical protein
LEQSYKSAEINFSRKFKPFGALEAADSADTEDGAIKRYRNNNQKEIGYGRKFEQNDAKQRRQQD